MATSPPGSPSSSNDRQVDAVAPLRRGVSSPRDEHPAGPIEGVVSAAPVRRAERSALDAAAHGVEAAIGQRDDVERDRPPGAALGKMTE